MRFSKPENVINSVISASQKISQPMIILGSWDAIGNQIERVERLKVEQALVLMTSGKNAKLMFVSEELELTTPDYLVDAVVTLRNDICERKRIRRIEWNKTRGVATEHWNNLYTLSGGRFTTFPHNVPTWGILVQRKLFKPLPHKELFYSTGSTDLDTFLGGGVRKQSFVIVEFGKNIGSAAFNLISTSIMCNFIMNDGCNLTIPSPGVSANRIRESIASHVPTELIDLRLRPGYFEHVDVGPCFFELDATSSTESYNRNMTEARKMKGANNRPCVFSSGSETLENVYSRDASLRLLQGLVQVRYLDDVLYAISRPGTALFSDIVNLSDTHIKIDEIDGTIVIQRLKPWSQLFALKFDFANGYPSVKLVPFL